MNCPEDFHAAILRQPKDVALRLAYADYLDRLGGEEEVFLSRFVRVEHVSARRIKGEWSAEVDGADTLSRHGISGPSYLSILAVSCPGFDSMTYGDVSCRVRHGFLDWFACSQHDWVCHVRDQKAQGSANVALRQPLEGVTLFGLVPELYDEPGRAFPSFRWQTNSLSVLPEFEGFNETWVHPEIHGRLDQLCWPYATRELALHDLSCAALHLARGTRPGRDPKRTARPRSVIN